MIAFDHFFRNYGLERWKQTYIFSFGSSNNNNECGGGN